MEMLHDTDDVKFEDAGYFITDDNYGWCLSDEFGGDDDFFSNDDVLTERLEDVERMAKDYVKVFATQTLDEIDEFPSVSIYKKSLAVNYEDVAPECEKIATIKMENWRIKHEQQSN